MSFFSLSLCVKICYTLYFYWAFSFLLKQSSACVDPESFIRKWCNFEKVFFFFGGGGGGLGVDEGRED